MKTGTASLWRRFLADRRASYGPIFALLIVPVFGSVAVALEFSDVFRARNDLQNALDAAALAAAKELAHNSDETYLAAYARDFFDANIAGRLDTSRITFSFAFTHPDGGGSEITVSAGYPKVTYVASVLGVDEVELDVTSVVAAGNRTVEVAVVLDNSSSMDTRTGGTSMTRIEAAKQAAANLVATLHTVAAFSNKPDPVRISVVPFAASVNVGAKFRGADWLDMNGWSSIHHQYLDWLGADTSGDSWPEAYAQSEGWKSDATTTNSLGPNPPDPLPTGVTDYSSNWLTRWTLLDAIGVDWGGCVEMRPSGLHATDATPTDLDPDTLFVPMFAPDEPDYVDNDEDDDYQNNYLSDYRRPGADYDENNSNSGRKTRQRRRQFWTAKYNSDAPWSQSEASNSSRNDLMGAVRNSTFGRWGPNQTCTTGPIRELTTSSSEATAAINAMTPSGYTNVQEGLAWGWRTLSANQPFTQGRPYSAPENDKYIILLTDGNNTYPNQSTDNKTEYYAWGYGAEERVLDGVSSWYSNVDAMDVHTRTTCDNIKAIEDADGEQAYRIFTIAYDVPDGSSVKSLLHHCASTNRQGQKYYYDVHGAAIAGAMEAIGNEISELRVKR
jgi:Flp pilus assembly protein TadG